MTEVGDLIGARYRLVGQVGSGSMGVVWQATDEILRRDVAVKELRLLPGMSAAQTDEARRRTMREGRITARLHHPKAITVYDVAEHNGRPCLIMEFLPSSSLSDQLDDRGALSVDETAKVGAQIAAALAAAHDAGIVHRDVKPGNVLLTRDGTAKLTDFGISHAVGDGTITASGVLAGTPAFLAPEVAKGQDPDFRSDVFSLGATLYTALEGQPPFGTNDNPIGMLHTIATQDVIPPKNAGALTGTLTWMLRMDPASRPTMPEAQAALTAISEGKTESQPTPAVPPMATAVLPSPPPATPAATRTATPVVTPAKADPPPNRQPRRRALAAVAIVAVLAAVGLVIALLNRGNGPANATGRTTTSQQTTTQQAAPPPATTTTTTHGTVATSVRNTGTQAQTSTSTGATKPAANPGLPAVGTEADPVTFIEDYYKLMPGNLSAGWPLMTPSYQQGHAGGWSGYTSYWSQFSSVSLSNVAATGPDSVIASLHYVYRNGGTIDDRTSFGLVQQNGHWQIASSSG